MSHIMWGPRGIWTFFLFLLSQRLLVAQIDQYYEVSQDAFFDMVTYKCGRRVTHSDTIMECVQFCSMPGRPRCFAMALDSGCCWVCGEDVPGQQVTASNIKASTYWVHAGWYDTVGAYWLTAKGSSISTCVICLPKINQYLFSDSCTSVCAWGIKCLSPTRPTCNSSHVTLYVRIRMKVTM